MTTQDVINEVLVQDGNPGRSHFGPKEKMQERERHLKTPLQVEI